MAVCRCDVFAESEGKEDLCAVAQGELAAKKMREVVSHAVIGRDDVALRRIVEVWQLLERHVADPLVLADALETAHGFVPVLRDVADRLGGEIERRGWIATGEASAYG